MLWPLNIDELPPAITFPFEDPGVEIADSTDRARGALQVLKKRRCGSRELG